jgi:hypothetical protein
MLKLRELPELTPPPGTWERVLAAHAARTAARRFRLRAMAAAAVVAAVGAASGYVVTRLDEPPRPTISAVAPTPASPSGGRVEPASYAPLVAESARLERLLAELPSPRPLMVASTAGAIVGLEDRIAVIDTELSYAAAEDLAPPYRQALWGERVELMNALVYVRFAQLHGH